MSDSIDNQINYKLGKIEQSVDSISQIMKSQFANLEAKIGELSKRNNEEVKAVEQKQAELETNLNKLKARIDGIYVKGGFLVAAVSTFWLLFGEALKAIIH